MPKSIPRFQSLSTSSIPLRRHALRAASQVNRKQTEAGSGEDAVIASRSGPATFQTTSSTQSTPRGTDAHSMQSEHLHEQLIEPGQSIGGFAHEIGPREQIDSMQKHQGVRKSLLDESRSCSLFHKKPINETKTTRKLRNFLLSKVRIQLLGDQLLFLGSIAIMLLFFPGYLLAWLAYRLHTKEGHLTDVDADEGAATKEGFITIPNDAGEPRLSPPQIGCL